VHKSIARVANVFPFSIIPEGEVAGDGHQSTAFAFVFKGERGALVPVAGVFDSENYIVLEVEDAAFARVIKNSLRGLDPGVAWVHKLLGTVVKVSCGRITPLARYEGFSQQASAPEVDGDLSIYWC